MSESRFQSRLIKRLKNMFPGCEIIRGDATRQQGIPDLFILWGPYWASLEVKESKDAPRQPNQNHFIEKLGDMSFAAYIYPENEEVVLSALQQAFASPGGTRISQS